MKKIVVLLLILSTRSSADIGCMDNSKYTDTRDGYDYKKYYYVECYCPCDRYPQSFKRGLCTECVHYRAPKKLSYRNEPKSSLAQQKMVLPHQD